MVVFSHSRFCDGKIPIKLTISAAGRLGAPILLINRSNLTTCAMRFPIAHKSTDLPSKWGTHKESITQWSVPQYIVCVNTIYIIFCAYVLQKIYTSSKRRTDDEAELPWSSRVSFMYSTTQTKHSLCTLTNACAIAMGYTPVPGVIQERQIVCICVPVAEIVHSTAWEYAVWSESVGIGPVQCNYCVFYSVKF